MSKLEELYRLQKLDDEIDSLNHELERVEEAEGLKKLKAEIADLKKQINEEEQKEQQKNKQLKAKEFEDDRLTRQLAEYEEQMYSGESSAKELEQLQTKISKVKEEQSQLEEQILNLMLELEELTENKEKLVEELELKEKELFNLRDNHKEKQSKIESELKKLKNNRQDLSQVLGEELLEEYQALLRTKAGLAVVELQDDYCMGCRVALPTRLVQKVQTGNELIKCESCGRILYWEED